MLRRVALRRSPFRSDPVTAAVYQAVMVRDSGCVAPRLGAGDYTCHGRLTLDHVKDQPRMGKRAPSDPEHLVVLCEHHHLEGWATSHRPELRDYLRLVNDGCGHVDPVHGCSGPCNRADPLQLGETA